MESDDPAVFFADLLENPSPAKQMCASYYIICLTVFAALGGGRLIIRFLYFAGVARKMVLLEEQGD